MSDPNVGYVAGQNIEIKAIGSFTGGDHGGDSFTTLNQLKLSDLIEIIKKEQQYTIEVQNLLQEITLFKEEKNEKGLFDNLIKLTKRIGEGIFIKLIVKTFLN